MNLIVDVGNTRVKVAVFKQDRLIDLIVFEKTKIISEIKKVVKKYTIEYSIVSSVANLTSRKIEQLQKVTNFIILSSKTKVQFKNKYKTPKTLGVDRIALVNAAFNKFPNQNVLIIDAGTCITFDFINQNSEYLGGAISPGLAMRYKALHSFTSNLPLVKTKTPKNIIGQSTEESINAGVINGVIKEIEGVINDYKNKYFNLTVVLTGGDTKFLSKQLKSSIFANQNFLLEGLNNILIYNKNK
jgi:type III pantothenate kinase